MIFKSSVMSAFFMDFLDKNKGMSLATMSVFNITLLFPNIIGISTFCNFVRVVDRMILNFLLFIFNQTRHVAIEP